MIFRLCDLSSGMLCSRSERSVDIGSRKGMVACLVLLEEEGSRVFCG